MFGGGCCAFKSSDVIIKWSESLASNSGGSGVFTASGGGRLKLSCAASGSDGNGD